MNRPRWIKTFLLVMLLLSQSIGAAERVRVHAPARTFVQFPFWIGIDKKFYEAQGPSDRADRYGNADRNRGAF